jgi:3-methyladenine DNA glycosylase AlkD
MWQLFSVQIVPRPISGGISAFQIDAEPIPERSGEVTPQVWWPNTVLCIEMKPQPEIVILAEEIHSRINQLAVPNAVALRAVRREFSRRIADASPQSVVQLALCLLTKQSDFLRIISYEMLIHHRLAFEQLTMDDLLKLGEGMNCWSTVDCFAMYLSGPLWARGSVSDKTVKAWARSQDRWWRRAALVSTVALSRGGDAKDFIRVAQICTLLVEDRDDMVVKALSWALREAAKKHPELVKSFLAEHQEALAARVRREVNNKLTTGLKTPRSRAKNY